MPHSVLLDCLPRYGCDCDGLTLAASLFRGSIYVRMIGYVCLCLDLHVAHLGLGLPNSVPTLVLTLTDFFWLRLLT